VEKGIGERGGGGRREKTSYNSEYSLVMTYTVIKLLVFFNNNVAI